MMRCDDARVTDVYHLPTPGDVKAGILEAIHERGYALDERLGHVLFTMYDLSERWHTDEQTAGMVAEVADAYYGGLMVTTEGERLFAAEAVLLTEAAYPALLSGGCIEVRASIWVRLAQEAEEQGYIPAVLERMTRAHAPRVRV